MKIEGVFKTPGGISSGRFRPNGGQEEFLIMKWMTWGGVSSPQSPRAPLFALLDPACPSCKKGEATYWHPLLSCRGFPAPSNTPSFLFSSLLFHPFFNFTFKFQCSLSPLSPQRKKVDVTCMMSQQLHVVVLIRSSSCELHAVDCLHSTKEKGRRWKLGTQRSQVCLVWMSLIDPRMRNRKHNKPDLYCNFAPWSIELRGNTCCKFHMT